MLVESYGVRTLTVQQSCDESVGWLESLLLEFVLRVFYKNNNKKFSDCVELRM